MGCLHYIHISDRQDFLASFWVDFNCLFTSLSLRESKFSDGKFSWNGLFWPGLDIPAPFTIIKLTQYLDLSRGLEDVVGILILEFEILAPGDQIGVKLGNPAEIGYDGNVTGGSLEAKLIALG